MKKILVVAAILVSSLSQAQQEIKIDIFDALVLKTVEVSYEHYVSENSSVGISALFNFEKQSADFRYGEDKMITPYFRHYFTTEAKWNFFGEAFLGINSGDKEIEVTGQPIQYVGYTDGALGIAVGTKYISDGGFTVDAYAGLGRNLFGSNSPIIVPRVGLNLGYRF